MTWVLAPTAIALWALTLSRLRASATSRAQSVMTATVLALAAAVTLNVPAIWQAVITAGGEPVAIVADHVLTMTVQTLILLFVHEITGRGLTTRAIVGAAAVAVAVSTTALLILGPTSAAMLYKNAVQHHPAGWPWLAYWSATIAFGFWAFGSGARFYWRYPRQAGERGEALGFVLIGVGTTIALLLTVLRAGVLISAPLRQLRIWGGWAESTAFALGAVLSVIIAAGLMAKPTASWLARVKTWRDHRRSVADLEPLWAALTAAVPNIALDQRAMASLMGARLSPHDRLYRRMIEVNDGLLALAPYTSAPLWRDALDQALANGETRQRAHVVADTVALHVALARYRARSPVAQTSRHLVTRQADDFSAEIQRLSELARASTHCPLTAQITTQQMREMESA